MADVSPDAVMQARKNLGVPTERIPRHIGIIMDGNGRWARQRGLVRTEGHKQGAVTVRKIITECARLGLEGLSLYSFSIENWSRPKDEVNILMHLYAEYLANERPTLINHNIRLIHLGRRGGLPQPVLKELDESVDVTKNNTGMKLCLALNYGSRTEITDAVRNIALNVKQGIIEPDKIDEELISRSLDTAEVPDPDLVIRTSGELRLSNFLLWQISYAEFYATETHWPDFNEQELHKVIKVFAGRNRRFGSVDESNK